MHLCYSLSAGIRQLQLILFKVALILGVEIHVNLEFVKVLEPPEDQENQSIVYHNVFLFTVTSFYVRHYMKSFKVFEFCLKKWEGFSLLIELGLLYAVICIVSIIVTEH